MAIELTGIVIRHERRLRLVFSNELDVAAFGIAPTYYAVTNQDGRGPSPGISAALVIVGAATNVELALDADLVRGALYRITALGVPATDLSESTEASDELVRFSDDGQIPNAEPRATNGDLVLFGRDLVHTGTDYLETAEGDLATTSGLANASAALLRRLTGSPLPWNPGYSPRAREFVDVPRPAVVALQGRLIRQALEDDRVRSVEITPVIDGEEAVFDIKPRFIGGRAGQISVPVGS